FAASIVAGGALRGAGDTLVPSLLNLASMWGLRIPLAAWLVARHGLAGAWIAMAVELCARGLLFLARLAGFDGRRRG
ncbi:MAG: multidrug transporter, partial [Kiritimatiellae bacterium]|nr:multidrug transporter [Kiritimatiellia bacterium]